MTRTMIIGLACASLIACKSIEERYAAAVCEKNFECCETSEIPTETTESDCREGLELGVSSMIAEAERRGARVRLVSADLGDPAAAAGIIAGAANRFQEATILSTSQLPLLRAHRDLWFLKTHLTLSQAANLSY